MGRPYKTRMEVSRKFPLRYGCICGHAASTQIIMYIPIFTGGCLKPQDCVIKSQVWLKCPLQISRFFSVARMYKLTMGCKRSFRVSSFSSHSLHKLPCDMPILNYNLSIPSIWFKILHIEARSPGHYFS